MNAVAEAFEAGRVDLEAFDHRAHVRAAWHVLRAYPLLEALPRFCAGLHRLVVQAGAESKYHATMSVAFLLLIHERMRAGETWEAFAEREADFIEAGMAPVRRFYGEAELERGRARFELPAQPRRDL